MKKSLIALAVLAASGAAMAQSSVTMYGRLDASVASKSTTSATGAKLTQTQVADSNLNSTFWGLKGSEDLGGGLKANFKLESRFGMDTGSIASGNTLFEREANVGLSGAFGAVNLGRIPTSYDDLHGATNNVFNSNFATTGDVNANGIAAYTGTISNSIKYVSPTFSGVSGAVQLGFGEDKTAALSATKTISAHIKYAAGPLLVGYAYQAQESRIAEIVAAPTATPPVVGVAASNAAKIKYNLFAGSYDFGVAKLTGGYSTVKQAAIKDKEYQLGVSVPFGAVTVAAGYSNSNTETAGVERDGKGYSLVATYDLSKRTTLYTGYENVKLETVASAAQTTKVANFAAGVRHTF